MDETNNGFLPDDRLLRDANSFVETFDPPIPHFHNISFG